MAALAFHIANPTAGLRISPPFHGTDDKWTALLTRAIIGSDGRVIGIGIAYLNSGYFEDFYHAVELNENGSIILHLRDGTVLARFPHVDSAIGTSFADTPPFKDVLSHEIAGTLLMESPIDGSIRVTAIRALAGVSPGGDGFRGTGQAAIELATARHGNSASARASPR